MIDHFRTLLLNLSYQIGSPNEYITKDFSAIPLQGALFTISNILLPSTLSRSARICLTQAYLETIIAAGLDEAFTLLDPRITYDLDTDFPNFQQSSYDLDVLYNQLVVNSGAIDAMLNLEPVIDSSKYDNIWLQHPNKLYKIAGLIVSYVLRIV